VRLLLDRCEGEIVYLRFRRNPPQPKFTIWFSEIN